MARRRFFVDSVHNQQAELLDDDARHLTQVLRVEEGQHFEISDNRNVYLAVVETARKSRVVFHTVEKLEFSEFPYRIRLLVSLIKFDHLELILEKATELGVSHITVIDAIRTEKGLERAAEKRMQRWRRILLEASQQSRRSRLPEIEGPVRLDQALKAESTLRLLLDEQRSGTPILRTIDEAATDAALLVGPEGGWTDAERTSAIDAGWRPVSLGPLILRTETAAIAALAILNAAFAAR